jgi:hypothetical protein
VLFIAALALSTWPRNASAAKPTRPIVVAYFGDSLASEAQQYFRTVLTSTGVARVRAATYGGTAICDFLERMRHEAARRPQAAVIQFSGNAYTPCMRGPNGLELRGDLLLAKYRADAEEAVRIFDQVGAHVYLVGAPPTRDDATSAQHINDLYRSVAAGSHSTVHYVDAGQAVLHNGRYTATLPCTEGEPCNPVGRNIVRAPDGRHFCPTLPRPHRGVTEACSEWSSGGFRYGIAMAKPIMRDFNL